jgi:hypothetical protein
MIPNYDEDEWRREQRERKRGKIKFERVPLPKILQKDGPMEEPFATRFRIPDSYAAKLMFVKDGKYRSGPYKNPELPIFRVDDFTKVSNCLYHEQSGRNQGKAIKSFICRDGESHLGVSIREKAIIVSLTNCYI